MRQDLQKRLANVASALTKLASHYSGYSDARLQKALEEAREEFQAFKDDDSLERQERQEGLQDAKSIIMEIREEISFRKEQQGNPDELQVVELEPNSDMTKDGVGVDNITQARDMVKSWLSQGATDIIVLNAKDQVIFKIRGDKVEKDWPRIAAKEPEDQKVRARKRMYDAYDRAKGKHSDKFKKMVRALEIRIKASKGVEKLQGIADMLREEIKLHKKQYYPEEAAKLCRVADDLQSNIDHEFG